MIHLQDGRGRRGAVRVVDISTDADVVQLENNAASDVDLRRAETEQSTSRNRQTSLMRALVESFALKEQEGMPSHFDGESETAASATEKTGSTPNFQITWGGPLNGKIPIEDSRALAGGVHVVHPFFETG